MLQGLWTQEGRKDRDIILTIETSQGMYKRSSWMWSWQWGSFRTGHHCKSNMMVYKGWGCEQACCSPKMSSRLDERRGGLVSAPKGLARSGGDEALPRVERQKAESERYASRQDKLGCGSAKLIQAAVFWALHVGSAVGCCHDSLELPASSHYC